MDPDPNRHLLRSFEFLRVAQHVHHELQQLVPSVRFYIEPSGDGWHQLVHYQTVKSKAGLNRALFRAILFAVSSKAPAHNPLLKTWMYQPKNRNQFSGMYLWN